MRQIDYFEIIQMFKMDVERFVAYHVKLMEYKIDWAWKATDSTRG